MDAIYLKCSKPAIYAELHDGLEPFVHWHVTESIQECYDPEQIGALQEELEVEALVLERRSRARDRALGLFVSLLHYFVARQSGQVDVNAALTVLASEFDKECPQATFDDFPLDTSRIYEYVEEQRQNAGFIADDPAWHRQLKTSEKFQWTSIFKRSLELTRVAYVDACKRFEHRFTIGSEADLALLQLLSFDKLVSLVSMYKANPSHLPAPPPTVSSSATTTSGFWGQRIASKRPIATGSFPEFDPAHLVQAGRQLREACMEHIKAQYTSAPSQDINVVLSQALNPETNPERLIERADQLYSSAVATPASGDESMLRSPKELLSSALRILSTRDGERNTTLRIRAHNLRGHINLRLADLKPQHEANYLGRAISDWSASTELDLDQNPIFDHIATTEIRLESLQKAIKGPAVEEKFTTDGATSKLTLVPESGAIPEALPSTPHRSGTNKAKKDNKVKISNTTATVPSDAKEADPSKPREKTILESPFFRSDLVTGLMVDSLLALPFPHRALRDTLRFPSAAAVAAASQDHVSMLDRLAKSHQQTTKALTDENKAQLRVAIKSVSTVLALPDVQHTRDDSSEKVLRRTSLRLVLGTLHLLLNDFVKAQTELELVSDALKPNARQKSKSKATSDRIQHTAPHPSDATHDDDTDVVVRATQSRVQGQTFFLLAKTCWMINKVQEAVKFFRWFSKWYSEQQAEAAINSSECPGATSGKEMELAELDMTWWDKVVVVTKT